MSPAKPHALGLLCAICFFKALVGLFGTACLSFATIKGQAPLSKLREKTGLALHMRARDNPANARPISEEGKMSLRDITTAGARGDWTRISAILSKYQGHDIQVFTAAMHFALQCGQLQAGACLYNRLENLQVSKTGPTFTAALKIFSRLGEHDTAREIWAEANSTVQIDAPLAGARIDAAAAAGDVAAAAEVLDQMNRTGPEIEVQHVTSAIHACWQAKGNGHHAAKFLFQMMLDLGLSPNIATMTCLVGAYKSAPLSDLLAAKAELQQRRIAPNRAFVEVFLNSILQKPREAEWSLQEMLSEALPQRSPDRLAAATAAINEFKAAGVTMSTLTERMGLALGKLHY